MKINFQNQNNCIIISKRPKSGDKDKCQTIVGSKVQINHKYASYFQSPNKGEDLLFIKKQFQKMKNSNEKFKNKASNHINLNNNNSNTNVSSSYINFMSPINKKYYNKKQNNAHAKFLKNKLILNSIDSSSFMVSKEKLKPYNSSNFNINNNSNLSNFGKYKVSKDNKYNNNNNDSNINNMSNSINPLNSLKINCKENYKKINNKNALSNSNIIIPKMITSSLNLNKGYTPESSIHMYNRLDSTNINLNEQNIKGINNHRKNRSIYIGIYTKNEESNKSEIMKEKKIVKEKDKNIGIRKSYKISHLNSNNIKNSMNNSNNFNYNYNPNKLYSYKGMLKIKKNNKNILSNSNQNLLSNTLLEYNRSQNNNHINFFENYIKSVAKHGSKDKNSNNKSNKSISINISNNFNNISNKKIKQVFNSNNMSNVKSNVALRKNSLNKNKKFFQNNLIQSPKSSNISKTTKSSPKSSLNNLNSTVNKMNKKLKGHMKNKSISIITKSDVSLLFKSTNLNLNTNGSMTNHNNNFKIHYNSNHMNNSNIHDNKNIGNNLYFSYGNQYKYNVNQEKKLNLLEIGNNYEKKKINSSSSYNIYFKKKTQPNNSENIFFNHNNKTKINLTKNYKKLNTTSNNSKNIYINKNHLSKQKNLSSLNNSTHNYYNNIVNTGADKENEVNSPANNPNHQYQKTESIIVNNYNININNQINNSKTFFSNDINNVGQKKKDKNNNSNNIDINNKGNNNILNKLNSKKKKIFSQSLKDILISNNKDTKNFTANNSPINRLEILLNTNNNNKNNNEIGSDNQIDSNKLTYKKWSSNRDKVRKEIEKIKMFGTISNSKNEETDKIKIKTYNNINNNKVDSQRKNMDLKKRINEEIENNDISKNSLKNLNIGELIKENEENKGYKGYKGNKGNDNIIKNNKNKENNNINRNNDSIISRYNPTLSSRSSSSYDANYYMKESLKLSCYINKYFNKYKKYPDTSLHFYKYGRLIGQGAFGKVNLGLNILTGRIVAVKSFNKNNSELTGENMKKIKYETDLMKKLNHPNITKILEMFEDEKYFLIIMEYINGGNLFSFVKKRRKLSEKTAKFLFRQIILGIKYIHEQNIVHRDIKLENLLIDLNNNVKICDFGIGRKIENKNQLLHDQCGTLMYMAPEILLSTKEKGYEGFPVDIWSAGISLYIMLSGTLPFSYKKKKHIKNGEEIENEEEEEEEESINSKSKTKKNEDDNFELQYSIVYREPKYIENISNEARDLLKGLLNKDPKRRLTIEQILNHPWLHNFKEKNASSNKFHLFTKSEMIMLSKTFIDYRKANYDDLKENFTLSNLEKENDKNNLNEQNITSKSSILAPYNSIISESENSNSQRDIEKEDNDLFNDFNNSKIKLENEQIVFSKKIIEYNRLYELNNNGEMDNGVLINSKTQSSINKSDISSNSRTENKNKNNEIDDKLNLDLNITDGSCVIFNDNDESIEVKKIKKDNENKKICSQKDENEEFEQKKKINNILNQMNLMGYNKKYVLDCVEKNELCHASAVYYLMINYENI